MLKKAHCILCFHLWIGIGVGISQTNNKFAISLDYDIYDIPIRNPTIDLPNPPNYVHGNWEVGIGLNTNFEYWISKNIGIGLGVSVKKFRSEVDYNIKKVDTVVVEGYRHWSMIGLGPSFLVQYLNGKLGVDFGVSFYTTIFLDNNNFTFLNQFVGFNQQSGVKTLGLKEKLYPGNIESGIALWKVRLKYEIVKNLSFGLGIESILNTSTFSYYSMMITEYYQDGSGATELQNDFQYLRKYSAISIGMSYRFGLSKFSEVQ